MAFPSRRLILAAALLPAAAWAADETPVVAAAADLGDVLPKIVQRYTEQTGHTVKLVLGSSGNLATQIRQGAPFAMFMSADESFVDALARDDRTEGEGVLYAIGHIGMFVPVGSPLQADGTFADLTAGLHDGRVQRFAIANPEFAPYGRAARAALQHAGIWERIEPWLVLGENVGQTMQFASSGATQGGIVPFTLARTPAVAKLGSFGMVPDNWYPPLRQSMVLLRGAGEGAREFFGFIQSAPGRAVLKEAGYLLPGEGG